MCKFCLGLPALRSRAFGQYRNLCSFRSDLLTPCVQVSIMLTSQAEMIMRRQGHSPRFSLLQIQARIAAGEYHLTDAAQRDAEGLAFDEDDIVECIQTLTEDDYSHSLASEKRLGTFQDVYRRRMHGFPLYLKLQLTEPNRAVIIISFKRDGSI